jgi:Response regulators consisting of a CheY-like receiver domain and a winged-helix DNA-binding domain
MRLLIIEDEDKLRNTLSAYMKERGIFTDTASDGQDGLYYARKAYYDVVILDIKLPDISGLEVARLLRTGGNETPILMLTAMDSVTDKVEGLNTGADDYMTKPFSMEELMARINALARRQGKLSMNTLTVHDLSLSLVNHDLSCRGETIHLSHKEFEVIRMLIRNPDITITKDLMIELIWGLESEASDNNVEAYISLLRKKMKFLCSKAIIKNYQKLGYRLEAAD